jgi:hypothetical protein
MAGQTIETSIPVMNSFFISCGHYCNNGNIFILWAISNPILAFLVHWQGATARPMPWFLH